VVLGSRRAFAAAGGWKNRGDDRHREGTTKIGIIGAGHIGGTLARHFARAGDEVAVSNSRDPATLHAFVAEPGGDARAVTSREAAEFSEVVVVSVPFGRYRELPRDGFAGKIVIRHEQLLPAAGRPLRGTRRQAEDRQRAARGVPPRRPARQGLRRHPLVPPAGRRAPARRSRPHRDPGRRRRRGGEADGSTGVAERAIVCAMVRNACKRRLPRNLRYRGPLGKTRDPREPAHVQDFCERSGAGVEPTEPWVTRPHRF
jgi:NADP oxidoreductase coenzyme F420-dependent